MSCVEVSSVTASPPRVEVSENGLISLGKMSLKSLFTVALKVLREMVLPGVAASGGECADAAAYRVSLSDALKWQ